MILPPGNQPWFVNQRATILAELFIAKLKPDTWVGTGAAIAGDHFITWKGGKSLWIEVIAMTTVIQNPIRFPASKSFEEKVTEENFLLLVVHVINEQIYFGWASEITRESSRYLSMPIEKATGSSPQKIRTKASNA